jgi:hypothetical protein
MKADCGYLSLQAESPNQSLLCRISIELQFVTIEDEVTIIPLCENSLLLFLIDFSLLVEGGPCGLFLL